MDGAGLAIERRDRHLNWAEMKLVIMIPCLNEEATLPLVVSTIPKEIPGVDSLEILLINDGSTDRTVAIAQELGINYFIHHARNRGLAYSLRDGVRGALELGADIMVLTDGDNQYPQQRIPDLVAPIVDGRADIVIADRQTQTIEHFSGTKKLLQWFGTKVMNIAAGTDIPDSTSGFRAYSKEAAIKMNLIGRFNFAMETTLQASHKRLAIETIEIETNPKTRESRLFKSNWEHVRKSALALVNAYTMYKPVIVFATLGLALFIAGLVPFIIALASSGSHLRLLVIGAVLLVGGLFSFTLGIVANLTGINRSLIEDMLEEQRRQRYGLVVEEPIVDVAEPSLGAR